MNIDKIKVKIIGKHLKKLVKLHPDMPADWVPTGTEVLVHPSAFEASFMTRVEAETAVPTPSPTRGEIATSPSVETSLNATPSPPSSKPRARAGGRKRKGDA